MDSASMTASAKALAGSGLIRVVRFQFDYMASRRISAARKPPPRAEKLKSEFISAVDALDAKAPLIVGGRSMGAPARMTVHKVNQAGRRRKAAVTRPRSTTTRRTISELRDECAC
jgi:predicted alpha/beta-hydrolase family hydrolase